MGASSGFLSTLVFPLQFMVGFVPVVCVAMLPEKVVVFESEATGFEKKAFSLICDCSSQ